MNTFLVVDDDVQSRMMISTWLKEAFADSNLLLATNGKEALRILEKKTVDLIVSDWDMPMMNGLEMVLEIRKYSKLLDTPVLIISGIHTHTEDLEIAFRYGALDFVHKPIQKVEIIARLKSILALQDAYATIKEQAKIIRERKDQELSLMILQIHEKSQILESIQHTLGEKDSSLEEKHKKVLMLLKHDFNTDKQWSNFKRQYEELHPLFFKRLLQKFSDLSDYEQRLAVYIALRMDSYEIAQSFNITSGSLRNAKYRLKQKMQLAENQDLAEYIRAFNN